MLTKHLNIINFLQIKVRPIPLFLLLHLRLFFFAIFSPRFLPHYLGCCLAQYNLAYQYELGDGVKQDFNESARLYKLASDQGFIFLFDNFNSFILIFEISFNDIEYLGDAPSQNILASFYLTGKGVTKDINEALRLYKLAVDQGYNHSFF